MKKTWIDSHCHLADLRIVSEVDAIISRANALGVREFLQGGVGPEDWQRQEELRDRYPQSIGLCFGLHPYWVAEHSLEECEDGLDLLAKKIKDARALGETGLDFRPHIMKDSQALQIEIFEAQLELAEVTDTPVVLHLVQAFEKAQQIFDLRGVPRCGGMVHSFNGSVKEAEAYLKLGLHLSVGGPLARPDNEKLRQSVRETPLEMLLLESDSPDQPPPRFKGGLNEPASLLDVAEVVAQLKGLSREEILDSTSQNLRKLLGANTLGKTH